MFSIQAQSQISFYGSTGINISNTNFDLPENIFIHANYSSTTNPFITAGLTTPINGKINVLGELGFSRFGFKHVAGVSSFQTTVQYEQINLQTGLSYQLNPIRFEVGGYLGHNLTYKYKTDTSTWRSDIENNKKLNSGLFAGVNVLVYKNLSIMARYYYGLSAASETIYTDAVGNPAYELQEKINNIQLGITYKI